MRQRPGVAAIWMEGRPATRAEVLHPRDVAVQPGRLRVVDLELTLVPHASQKAEPGPFEATELGQLPDRGRKTPRRDSEILWVLPQDANNRAGALASCRARFHCSDAEVDERVALLGSLALSWAGVCETPRKLLAPTRLRARLVAVVEAAPAATRRGENEEVELTPCDPGLELRLTIGVEQVVGRAAHVNVQLFEVQAQAGLQAQGAKLLGDRGASGLA